MSKILTDRELAEIVTRLVGDDAHDDYDAYRSFMIDLSDLVTQHCGGTPGCPSHMNDQLGWAVAVHIDADVPEDGGIYKDYDTDVTWKDGKEDDE